MSLDQDDFTMLASSLGNIGDKLPSMRDWFAMMALNGILAAEEDNREFGRAGTPEACDRAYFYADMMIVARSKKKKG